VETETCRLFISGDEAWNGEAWDESAIRAGLAKRRDQPRAAVLERREKEDIVVMVKRS